MIEILNVSKKFRIYEDRSRDLKETAINFLKGKRRSYRDLWALKGLNVEIREGETVAFIGENGSGKSTLLKLLYGIYIPDEGKIITNGKISALLELGVGFHPDLTGEENIYLNGAMLGFDRREMKKRFDEIVSFSEIGDFIYSPIRTYSSGMAMRLGFSIAMCVDPDILLIDEVLAVGDEAFQQKCLKRLEKFKESGKTIVLVSHGLEMVKKFCERAILLHEGRIVIDDIPKKTIGEYYGLLSLKPEGPEFQRAEIDEVGEKSVVLVVEEEIAPKTDEQVDRQVTRKPRFVGGVKGHNINENFFSGKPRPVDGELHQVTVNEKLPDKESEIKLDPEKVRIIEVQDSPFFAGDLFFRAFGHPPPKNPTNYVAIHVDSKNPPAFHAIGFIHVEQVDDMGLVGGLCVDAQWHGKGLGKRLLSSADDKKDRFKALFVHTDDPRIAAECGYEPLPHPYLMVKWVGLLSPEEKKRLIATAIAIGPF